jgi:hypothetical protein
LGTSESVRRMDIVVAVDEVLRLSCACIQ